MIRLIRRRLLLIIDDIVVDGVVDTHNTYTEHTEHWIFIETYWQQNAE